MATGDLLNIHPTELKFPFEVKKQSSCCMQLSNKTNNNVAFKVKTTNPKKYCVRPNSGIVMPGTTCSVTITMQAQREAPPDLQCKDKFLVQSVAAPNGATTKDITPEMFGKEDGKVVEEFKLRVVYIPANPPSPVPEGSEEGSPPRGSSLENGNQDVQLLDAVCRSFEEPKEKSSGAWSAISKLTVEKKTALEQTKNLQLELELMRKQISKNSSGGFSVLFMLLVGISGILIGYFIKRS
ncbi:hypothetical protein K2173_024839 [Erythroxylum novogranatense]|uniref:MSP domain-containing protein n=1 Tax=Erythroxylum novogranatense TaxID=1862640 RepID=A0AAV8UCJ5_9ROSI|nr:hypothetical protein K2173_024839 [Erythroxylum novogranatense]